MRIRTALVTLSVLAAISGCSGSGRKHEATLSQPTPTASATPSAGSCTPSGTGTTDLTKKPVVAKGVGPAPTTTTTTDIVCGTGPVAVEGSQVEVKYVGGLYSTGAEFDASWKVSSTNTLPFQVGSGVIPGFSTGTEGMRVGGRRMIVIPPSEGYGAAANGPIPANSTLIFVIDLVSVA